MSKRGRILTRLTSEFWLNHDHDEGSKSNANDSWFKCLVMSMTQTISTPPLLMLHIDASSTTPMYSVPPSKTMMGPRHRCRSLFFLLLLLVEVRWKLKLSWAFQGNLPYRRLPSPRRRVAWYFPGVSRPRKERLLLVGRTWWPWLQQSSEDSTWLTEWALQLSKASTPEGELVIEDDDEEEDWVPDKVKARQRRGVSSSQSRIQVQHPRSDFSSSARARDIDFSRGQLQEARSVLPQDEDISEGGITSPYTDEEEDVIALMGGKSGRQTQREEGYLGDSTLQEIAQDYSIPVCYIADVLCTWGVPVPINIHDRLGDLVTGEQAFSLLEAANSLDVAAVQDRYSNQSLLSLCEEWGIDLQAAFEHCMKEGWSLPFGVQTCLRVEQEEELLRLYGSSYR